MVEDQEVTEALKTLENTSAAKDIEKSSTAAGEDSDKYVKIFPDASDTSVTKTILRSDWEKYKEDQKQHKNVYPSQVAGHTQLGKVVPASLQQQKSIEMEQKMTDNEELRKLTEE